MLFFFSHVLGLLAIKGLLAIHLYTNSSVDIVDGESFVAIPCEYDVETPNTAPHIEWSKGKNMVLEKHSSGKTKRGDILSERVLLGKGCSLVVYNPQVDDCGVYTIRIFVSGDEEPAEEKVELIIRNSSIQTPIFASSEFVSTFPSAEMTAEVLGRYTFVLPFLLSILCIIRIVHIAVFHFTVSRKSPQSMTKGKRQYYYPVVAVIFVSLVTALVYSGMGYFKRDVTSYRVSSTLGILGCVFLFLRDCYVQVLVYKRTEPDTPQTDEGDQQSLTGAD